MKKIFKKAMTVLSGVALIGMTVGVASAAAYPAPFTSNTAIVVGANAAPSDGIAASLIAADLDANAVVTTTAGGTITGETASLESGSDLLYLNDELNENVQTLTKTDLPTVLADGTFVDDAGTSYDYEQTIVIGTSATNNFAFGNTDNDLDDPALMLELSNTAATEVYTSTVTFNKAINFTSSNSEGEEIVLFGKTYTVGTATDSNTLILLGGADAATINVGESTTMVVDGISYDVSLVGLSSATTTQASVSVNGETKTFTQGQTKTIGGIDVYVKTVFRTGDDAGYAEVQLGADKLTLETGNAVQTGSDADDIEGTLVTFTPSSATGVEALTKIQIEVAAEDNDNNHLMVGESFVDSVFGSFMLNFNSVVNGPTFTDQKDTGRTTLEIQKGGNRELQVELTDNAGNTATIPFAFETNLADDDGKTIEIVEGASIAQDEYFILNSGNNQHFMQMTKVNMVAATLANSDVAMKDLISGTTYTFDNHDFNAGYSATISGQTYNITNVSSTEIKVVSSDYGIGTGITNGNVVDVFPMIELISGEDTRFAFTDSVLVLDDFVNGVAKTVTLNLPTGTLEIAATAAANVTTVADVNLPINTGINTLVGDVYYNVSSTLTVANTTDITVAIAAAPATGGLAVTTPGLLFVEDEDKSDGTTKPAIHIVTTDTGASGYTTVSSPVFSGVTGDADFDTETWDDTDLTGWLTNYGTYVWKDTSDSNQNFVGLSYGDAMMYAEVSFAEGEVSTTTSAPTEAGVMTVMDDAVSSVAGKHLVVVGGSAINSVAASLLGAAYSEAAFTSATGVAAGEFLIQSFAREGKTALLVAGYNAADTEKAVTYLLNNDVATTTGTKLKGTSATEATLVTA